MRLLANIIKKNRFGACMACVFCDIVNDHSKGHIIYEDDLHLAFLDLYPITEGHCLVVPKKHYEMITDMSPADTGNLFSIVPFIARGVVSATKADAFSLGQNNGKAARQVVPHVHVHIIPRYADRDTMWLERGMPDGDELKMLASKIRESLASALVHDDDDDDDDDNDNNDRTFA